MNVDEKALGAKFGKILRFVVFHITELAVIEVKSDGDKKELILINKDGQNIPLKRYRLEEYGCENLEDAKLLYPSNSLLSFCSRGDNDCIDISDFERHEQKYIACTKDRSFAIFLDESELIELATTYIREKYV